ncbi:phosphohydrolase [Halobacteriales archaeon SW_5_70_135]|nr:MAG: phosphohydrolase [Halobacteriales archaeon SW_5_70_135]
MTTIKDSVHDHVTVEGVARDLLDTPPMQRLRRVKQLGTVPLVYPSANHTRFEHSLGVYHLACEAIAHMEAVDDRSRQARRVKAAALLHDVGHGPFSHNLEALIHRRTGKYHDDVDGLLADGAVADVLRSHDLSPATIADLVAGEGRLGQLISGELDVDRMDYLVRDAHHTGVPYGTIDHGRLVRELTFVDGDLVLSDNNVQTAESLLVARALMNPTVYSQHAARISKTMLRRGAERLLRDDVVDAERLRRMDDHDFTVALRRHDATAEDARRYDHRDLYKRAVWAELQGTPDDVIDAGHDEVRELEADVAERADVPDRAVILDVPERPSMTESSSRVVVNGEVRRLAGQSSLVRALERAGNAQWRMGVYTPAEHADDVGRAAAAVLGLDVDGALVSEVPGGVHTTLDEFADDAGE